MDREPSFSTSEKKELQVKKVGEARMNQMDKNRHEDVPLGVCACVFAVGPPVGLIYSPTSSFFGSAYQSPQREKQNRFLSVCFKM